MAAAALREEQDGARMSAGGRSWRDMAPVPENDGPSPVVAITYRDHIREAMDYFRNLYDNGKYSLCSLRLSANTGNCTVAYWNKRFGRAMNRSMNMPKPVHKGLGSITLLTPWILWKHRNDYIFNGAQTSVRTLIDKIKSEATLWAQASASV